MATKLTPLAEEKSLATNIEPQLVLEIEGVSTIYGTTIPKIIPRYGDGFTYGISGLIYGQLIDVEDSKDYIDISKSSSTITQQLKQDEGGSSSTSSFTINLVDKNGEITSLITPGKVLTDIMQVKATVWLGFEGTEFPVDFIKLFIGNIDSVKALAGSVNITISHPDNLKRQDLYQRIDTDLTAGIDASTLTIPVISTNGMLLPADSGTLKAFVRIDDEIIEYTSFTSTVITATARGALGTTAAAHDDTAPLQTVYQLNGDAIDLALKVMLSGGDSPWIAGVGVQNFVKITDTSSVANSVFFNGVDVEQIYGLVVGDTATTTGASNGSNNFTDGTITSVVKVDTGSYLVFGSESLVEEEGTAATISFKTQFNVLSDGLGMDPDQVDVNKHLDVQGFFPTAIAEYKLNLKETIEGNAFIDNELYFPSSLYSIPVNGKSSVGLTFAPFTANGITILDDSNILNAKSLGINRSTRKDFYNSVVWRYEQDVLTDRFLKGVVNLSATSTNRIKNTRRSYKIDSTGLRNTPATTTLINTNQTRILDRYRFGAESLSVRVNYKTGFNLNVGDIVQGNFANLSVSDISSGTRDFSPRLFEIKNKKFNYKQGNVDLVILDTGLSASARYGVFSPSALVGSGSTTTTIKIVPSFGQDTIDELKNSFTTEIGNKILVHSEDFTVEGETTLVSFSAGDSSIMNVSPALAFTPTAGYIIDVVNYTGESSVNQSQKQSYCFFNPTINVASGASGTVFDVVDASGFFVDSIIKLHNEDYSVDSADVTVLSVFGTTITVDTDLGFTPSSSEIVELIGFISDEGAPYRFL